MDDDLKVYIQKTLDVYREKWRKHKNGAIWEIYPEMMIHTHLMHEPMINFCLDLLKFLPGKSLERRYE